jgi:hypothetical protein
MRGRPRFATPLMSKHYTADYSIVGRRAGRRLEGIGGTNEGGELDTSSFATQTTGFASTLARSSSLYLSLYLMRGLTDWKVDCGVANRRFALGEADVWTPRDLR